MRNSLALVHAFFFIFLFFNSFGQWNDDTLIGGKMLIKNQYLSGSQPAFSISDNSGGSVHAFKKFNGAVAPAENSIHLQRIDSTGSLRWGTPDSGTILTRFNNYSALPSLFDLKPGNQDGAYVLYSVPNRTVNPDSFYLCVQQIDTAGIALWPFPGKVITSGVVTFTASSYFKAKLCIAPTGVCVLWRTNGNERYGKLYAQKIAADGRFMWDAEGVEVCTAPSLSGTFYCVPDGTGGMVAAFLDSRNGIYNDSSGQYNKMGIYAQRINSNGERMFGDEGILAAGNTADSMTLLTENETARVMLPDGAGGCYFFYGKYSGVSGGIIYTQRLDSIGQPQWGNYGSLVKVTSDTDFIYSCKLYLHPSGGSIISVYSTNGGSSIWNRYHLFLQSFNSEGVRLFSDAIKAGLATKSSTDRSEYAFDALVDFAGNTTLLFYGAGSEHSPRFQIIRPDGTLVWDAAGKTIVRKNANRVQVLAGNNGYTLLQWFDNRNQPAFEMYTRDVFVSRIDQDGNISSSRRTIISTSGGNWNDPGTWQGGVVPGPGDIVNVAHAVVINADASCYSLTVQQPEGNVAVISGVNFIVLH